MTTPASETTISNAALVALGERRITSLEDNSKNAKLLKERFPEVRDDLLRSYTWSFATKRARLATVKAPLWGFDNAYQLPNDCLRLIACNNPAEEQYRVEGRQVVTDIGPELEIEYTSAVTDVSQMDVLFREALAAKLALDLAEAVTGSTAKVKELGETFKTKLRAARTPDSQEQSVRVLEASNWLDAREEGISARDINLSPDGFPL